MRRAGKLILVSVTAAAVVSAGTVFAYASWPVPSRTVKVKVHAVEMPQGVRPSAARSGADAVVTWSPQEIAPGTTMQSYVVRRHNADDATVVKAFTTVTGTTFTDAAVPTGKWYWTVTPKFAGWIGTESKKSENLKFTATAPPEPTALVANKAPAPAATSSPPTTVDAAPVPSSPAPVATSTSPVAAGPESDQTDVPPPPGEGSSPAVESNAPVDDGEK